MFKVILLLLYLRFSRSSSCIDSPSCYGLDLWYNEPIDLNCCKTQDHFWVNFVKWFIRTLRSRIARWANWPCRTWTRTRKTHLHRKPRLSIRWSILTNDRNQFHRNNKMALIRWTALRNFLSTWIRNSDVEGGSNFEITCWYPNHLRWRRISNGTIIGLIWGRSSNH